MKKTDKKAMLDDGIRQIESKVYEDSEGTEFVKIGFRFVKLGDCFARYKSICVWM